MAPMNSNYSIGAGLGGALLFLMAGAVPAAGKDSDLGPGIFARINTNRGEIVLKLEYEKVPLTVCNFVSLAEGTMEAAKGKPFYDGISFHRVIDDFMVQTGDPRGNGSGGPGYRFDDEFHPSLRHEGPGILSMANAGPGTNGSQFFITHVATPWLDNKHSVFGKVVKGQHVVNMIKQGDKMMSVTIIRNGPDALAFKTGQAAFDALKVSAAERARTMLVKQREADLQAIAAQYPDLKTSDSGVLYKILAAGTGAKPAAGKKVKVNYKGMFLSGEVFDASELHGGPIEFVVGQRQVIPGWDESVMDMAIGEKRLAVIPPELAYGERGAGGVIPPNAFLVFEMELVSFK
jgi:peptidylprolyl isomerase